MKFKWLTTLKTVFYRNTIRNISENRLDYTLFEYLATFHTLVKPKQALSQLFLFTLTWSITLADTLLCAFHQKTGTPMSMTLFYLFYKCIKRLQATTNRHTHFASTMLLLWVWPPVCRCARNNITIVVCGCYRCCFTVVSLWFELNIYTLTYKLLPLKQ